MKAVFLRLSLAGGALISWLALPIIAWAMSATNVQPANLVQSNRTTVTLTFTIAATLPANGKVKAIFPAGYNVASASGGTCSTLNGGFMTSVSGQTVTITRDGTGTPELVGAQTCTINNISNPSSTGSTGTYTIQITDAADTVLDQDAAVAADTITATGTLTATNFISENQVANTISRYTVNFTTANNLTADGRIKLTFPSGFDVSGANSPHCTTIDGGFSLSTSGQSIIITRSATGTAQAPAAESCFVRGIKAPADPTPDAGHYSIETQDGLGNPTDTTSTIPGDAFYASTTLSATNVAPASLVAGAVSINTISFTTVTTTPIGARIRVTYPSAFSIQSSSTVDCTTIAGTETGTVSGTTITIQTNITGGEAAGAETCTISGVQNPITSGSTGVYRIEVLDENGTGAVGSDLAVTADTITPGTLTATDVAPENLVVSSTQVHTVTFTTQNQIPADGKILITYPNGFSLASASTTVECAGIDGTLSVTTSSQTMTLSRSAGTITPSGSAIECILHDMRNRDTAGASGFYNVTTTNSAGTAIDWAVIAADTYIVAPALTLTNVQPVSLVQNVITDQDVAFTISVNIPEEARISITYGSGFVVSGFSTGTCTGFDSAFTVSTSSQTISLTRVHTGTTSAAGAKSCRIFGIQNPPTIGSTGTYTINILDKSGVFIATGSGVTADTITVAGTLTTTDVQPASLVAGATTTVDTLFTFSNGWPFNGRLLVQFPSGFVVSPSSVFCSGLNGSYTASASSTNGFVVTRGGSATGSASGIVSCDLTQVKNPAITGSTGVYGLYLYDIVGTIIASSTAVAADTLTAGAISGNIEPDTLRAGATGTASVTINASNPIPSDGKLDISFPAGFYLGGVTTSTISCTGLNGTFTFSRSGQTITVLRVGGTTSTENPPVFCSIPNVRNPMTAGAGGAYTLRTKTFADITIDENTAIATDTFSNAGTLTSTNVQPASLTTGANTVHTITFTQALGIPANGSIRVTYAGSFNISGAGSASCSSMDGSFGTGVSGTSVIITRSGGTTETAGAQTCTVAGIVNPSSAGTVGNYTIETYTNDGLLIESDSAVSGDTFSAASTGGSSGGGGGGGGGSSAPVITTFQSSNIDVAAVRAQIEARLKTLPVAVHSLIKLPDDKNPKTQEDTAVYYVGADGLRHAFPNSKTYFSWYCDFSGVQTVSAATLASIGLGKNIPYRPGIRLVKFTTDAKVYIVTKGGILRPIPSEAFAKQLLGDTWNKQIDDISDAFYMDYQFGAEASDPTEFIGSTLAKTVTYPSDSLQIIGNTESAPLASLPFCSSNSPASSQTISSNFTRPTSIPAGYRFTSNLGADSAASIDIRYLQHLLIALGSDIYPEQRVTGNFGPATEKGLKNYQRSIGIPETGRTDAVTRDKLNQLLK